MRLTEKQKKLVLDELASHGFAWRDLETAETFTDFNFYWTLAYGYRSLGEFLFKEDLLGGCITQ